MRRAEVWWAELPPPVKSRPVVILTRNAVVDSIESLVVGLVTRTIRGLETEVSLGRREGLPCPCVANLDNILTLPRGRLKRQMGALSQEKTTELDRAIIHALGVSEW
jgi:mRNA interferase MazF